MTAWILQHGPAVCAAVVLAVGLLAIAWTVVDRWRQGRADREAWAAQPIVHKPAPLVERRTLARDLTDTEGGGSR